MPYSIQLHKSLDKASTQHTILTSKFKEFAFFTKDCMQSPRISNHNIIASLQHLDKGYFTTSYAGRIVSFVFASCLDEFGTMVGVVKCYLQKDFPECKQIEIGEFIFDEEGHTNLKLPNEDAKISIANDFGTLHITLHFIHESLSMKLR
jgi:hypothetical protein